MFMRTSVNYDEDDEEHVSRQLIGGDTDSDEHDLVLCQRESDAVFRVWPEHCLWGPVTGKAYFPAPADTSLGEQAGLWSVDCSGEQPGDPVFILPRSEILRMTCNPSETHLAILSYVRLPRSRELRLEIVDLATHTAKRLPIEHPVAHQGSENSLAWDDSGMKLAFADARGLNIYELATEELRLAFASPSDADYFWLSEPLVPLTWLHSGELLFFREECDVMIYEPASDKTRLSPLGKRIREWLKEHKPLPRRYLPLWQSMINSIPAGSLTPHVLATSAGDAWPLHPAFALTRIMGGGGKRR
jgi:hypothetical protein